MKNKFLLRTTVFGSASLFCVILIAGCASLDNQAAFKALSPAEQTQVKRLHAHDCLSCHFISGVGNTNGKSLDHAGSKHDISWIRTKIVNPKASKPDSKMRATKMPEADLQAVSEYLAGKK